MQGNNAGETALLNHALTSKIRLLIALSLIGCLLWLSYIWLYQTPRIEKTFSAQTLSFNAEATPVFCLTSETEFGLLSKKTKQYAPQEVFVQEANYRQRIKTCQAEFDAAIKQDEMLESALYKDNLDAFFERVRQNPTQFTRPLMLQREKLPKRLNDQLDTLAKGYAYLTAFDVALATKRMDDVVATMPNAEHVLPHQRIALFHLGAFSTVEQAKANNDQTLADDKLNQYQAHINLSLLTGDARFALQGLAALTTPIGASNQYSDYRGGFSDYDFLIANQGCDVRYASFLIGKKLQPTAQHVLHLLSLIGHTQYPGIGGEFSQFTFTHADPALGVPRPKALPQCVAVAKLYAQHVQGLNDPELTFSNGYYQTNAYDELYKIANDAVFQWWVRDSEKQYQTGRAPNTTVNGDPALLTQAVAEVLRQQPASFEQYCAWANNAHTWTTLVKVSQPNMVAPMLALPKGWKNAAFYYQAPEPRCNLSFGITNEYQYQQDGLAYMNSMLKQVAIPCEGKLVKDLGAYQLRCSGTHKPWPNIENAAALNP